MSPDMPLRWTGNTSTLWWMQQKRYTRMLQHSTTSHIHCTADWATSRLYFTFTPFWQTSEICYTTWEKLPYIPWIMLMQQQQEYSHLMYYMWKISEKMLLYIEKTLPSTMHLIISSEEALHLYRYLCTHILIADEQFLLLIEVPIQDHEQLEIYEVFNLAIPHGNFSTCYNINNRYLGIMYDETKAVEISEDQFRTCQQASGQSCSLNPPLLPLVNPPRCITALYAKDKASIEKRCLLQIRKANSVSIPMTITPNVWIITSLPTAVSSGIMFICPGEAPRSIIPQTPIHILGLQPACSTTSWYFHLPLCYEIHDLLSTYYWTQLISML